VKRTPIIALAATILLALAMWMLPTTPPVEVADPDDALVQSIVADIEAGSANPMESILKLRAVAERNPDHRGAQLWLGKFSMMTGQWDNAVDRFQLALDAAPAMPETAILLSEALQKANDMPGAMEALRQFQEINPDLASEVEQALEQLLEASDSQTL